MLSAVFFCFLFDVRCVLTPNAAEFERLVAAALIEIASSSSSSILQDKVLPSESKSESESEHTEGVSMLGDLVVGSKHETHSKDVTLECLEGHNSSDVVSNEATHSNIPVREFANCTDVVNFTITTTPTITTTATIAEAGPESDTSLTICDMLTSSDDAVKLAGLSRYLGVTILRKGEEDMIGVVSQRYADDDHLNGTNSTSSVAFNDVIVLQERGSPRRCGGQVQYPRIA